MGGKVVRERGVETVSADDLVQVWGGYLGGVYERVDAVDY
jgi:hypothetical protein